jgi:hypothetical protein
MRYYHVFEEGELEQLVGKVEDLQVGCSVGRLTLCCRWRRATMTRGTGAWWPGGATSTVLVLVSI